MTYFGSDSPTSDLDFTNFVFNNNIKELKNQGNIQDYYLETLDILS